MNKAFYGTGLFAIAAGLCLFMAPKLTRSFDALLFLARRV